MNRMFFVAVVGLMAVGAMGCATGVEDPQPGPAPITQSRGTPATPFSADIPDNAPIDPNVIGGLDAPEDQFVTPPDPDESNQNERIDPNLIPKIEVHLEAPVNG